MHRMLNIPEKMAQYVNDYKKILAGSIEYTQKHDMERSVVMTVALNYNHKLELRRWRYVDCF